LQQVLGVLVVTDVRAVQQVHDLAVNVARGDALLFPNLAPLFGSAAQVEQFASRAAKLADGSQGTSRAISFSGRRSPFSSVVGTSR
jgi:hypothetical protein